MFKSHITLAMKGVGEWVCTWSSQQILLDKALGSKVFDSHHGNGRGQAQGNGRHRLTGPYRDRTRRACSFRIQNGCILKPGGWSGGGGKVPFIARRSGRWLQRALGGGVFFLFITIVRLFVVTAALVMATPFGAVTTAFWFNFLVNGTAGSIRQFTCENNRQQKTTLVSRSIR